MQGIQDAVAETASSAQAVARESLNSIYSDATRCRLDITMEAPEIIVPVHSQSKMPGFVADLGRHVSPFEFGGGGFPRRFVFVLHHI